MRKEEVKFRRYFPSEGKALKVVSKIYNSDTHELVDNISYYDIQGLLVDENNVISVEEVPLSEYNDWYEKNKYSLGIGML